MNGKAVLRDCSQKFKYIQMVGQLQYMSETYSHQSLKPLRVERKHFHYLHIYHVHFLSWARFESELLSAINLKFDWRSKPLGHHGRLIGHLIVSKFVMVRFFLKLFVTFVFLWLCKSYNFIYFNASVRPKQQNFKLILLSVSH